MTTTPGQQDRTQAELTRAAIDSFAASPSARFRAVMQSVVEHLHAFATDVSLTEEEWRAGIDFLTRTGHITDEHRQEFILLSDVLGLSMLTVAINHDVDVRATESTVFGPFFVEGAPVIENGADISAGASGEPCYISGRVLSSAGEPIPAARLEVWQADDQGLYDVQYDPVTVGTQGRGRLASDAAGRWAFWTVKPVAYPIPDDGPVGDLLGAARRGPMRPAHVHFMVSAPGFRTVTTHVFVDGDRYLDSDAVFGVRRTLVAPFTRHEPGNAPDGRRVEVPYWTASYDLILAPAAEH